MRITSPVAWEAENLPTRLPNPRDLTFQTQQPKANSAHTKPAQEPSHTSADLTPVIVSDRKLRLDGRFISER